MSSICACNSLTRRAAAALVFVTGAFALVSERICEVALAGALIADAAELDEAPAVLGFSESMHSYCNEHTGHGWNQIGDITRACARAGLNLLRISPWEWYMCKNV